MRLASSVLPSICIGDQSFFVVVFVKLYVLFRSVNSLCDGYNFSYLTHHFLVLKAMFGLSKDIETSRLALEKSGTRRMRQRG